jgi:hypothetical protein
MDILQFVSMEHQNFLVSLANNQHDLTIISSIQTLYVAAMAHRTVPENDVAVFQMLAFSHYHFLFSTAALMRGHLSEAFASARAAIDGALVGAQIIHDRPSQIAYTTRKKPFDNFARYLGNLIHDGKPLPHPLVPTLFDLHKKFSTFAGHADVNSFIHRVNFSPKPERTLKFEYFQFAKNETERQIHAFLLFHTFVRILDVFADFLVVEQKAVPPAWKDELHKFGQTIERHATELKKTLPLDEESQATST